MMDITKELFDQQRNPRFGTANPERMNVKFWEWMIRGGVIPLEGQKGLAARGWNLQEGKLKSSYGPYRARQMFNVAACDGGPIWTFERMGATQTNLADGRIVCIGGEHEDFYDPDFYIYNDVVVLGPAGEIDIYGYPKKVFPATDFHTATLIGYEIIVIGCIGYKDERRYGYTPVYRLDLADFRVTEIVSSGDMPGWISKHTARLAPDRTVVLAGGQVVLKRDEREIYRPNVEEFALDVLSGSWRRLTNRNWRQFAIRMDKLRMFDIEHWPAPKKLLPEGVQYSLVECDSMLGARIEVCGVPVAIAVGVSDIKIVVEGELAPDIVRQIVESIRINAGKAVEERCSLEEL